VTGCHARAHHPRHFGIRKPVLTTGAPQMLLRAFVFEAIVLAAFALFVALVVVAGSLLYSGVLP
jgi:hypothetical protein